MEEHENTPTLILLPPSSLLAGRGHSASGLCREGQGPDLVLPKHLRTVVMVLAGKSPSPTPDQTADNSLQQLRGWQEQVQLLC